MSEVTIEVLCGFANPDVGKEVCAILEYSPRENDPQSLSKIDVEDLFADDLSAYAVNGPALRDDGKLSFAIWGGVHDGDAFWDRLSHALIRAGADFLFAVHDNDQVAVWTVQALHEGILDTLYVTGAGGEFDGVFYAEDDTPLLDRLVHLYQTGRLTMPATTSEKLIALCQQGGEGAGFVTQVFRCKDINRPDRHGRLALNELIKADAAIDTIGFLAEQAQPCLDPRARDGDGKSALDIARDMHKGEHLEVLEDQVRTYEGWVRHQGQEHTPTDNDPDSR